MIGAALTTILALVFGLFITKAALRALATSANEVRQARILRRRGRTTTATILSLAPLDPECGTRQAVVRFEVESGRRLEGTVHLRWKGQPELIPGAQVQVRYDPVAPKVLASEAGRRQGHAEIREAVVISALMLVAVLPTSIYLVYAGLRALLP